MSAPSDDNATVTEVKRLEARIEELIRTCDRLRDENRSLREQQEALMGERARLIEKTELARNRVEAMINRLKSMEHGV
ncbi:MAG: TIGR02449 family protein [Gammaproteobacteria bacterium]|nr:TIGR02449 family protein [Gammaproteobacteria bacterium]